MKKIITALLLILVVLMAGSCRKVGVFKQNYYTVNGKKHDLGKTIWEKDAGIIRGSNYGDDEHFYIFLPKVDIKKGDSFLIDEYSTSIFVSVGGKKAIPEYCGKYISYKNVVIEIDYVNETNHESAGIVKGTYEGEFAVRDTYNSFTGLADTVVHIKGKFSTALPMF